jgi:hypothetical protein
LKGKNALVLDALIENRKLDLADTFTWSTGIKNVFQLINKSDIWNKPNIITKVNFDDIIVSNIRAVYSTLWTSHVNLSQP